MIYTRHSHCFSKCQLELIIENYLSLAPYYQILLQALKINVRRFQQHYNHPKDKPHPIRVYTKDYQSSRNVLEKEEEVIERMDIRATYASSGLKYFYLFPLEYVVQILESSEFYTLLPQNIIINGLLTTTNIQIIIETLSIISQEMSKNIRSTIAGKELRSNRPSQTNIEIAQGPTTVTFKENVGSTNSFVFESRVEIQGGVETPPIQKKQPPSLSNFKNKFVKKEISGTNRIINIDIEITEQECRFCQGYLIYLYQTVGQYPLDDNINRLTSEAFRCLNLISKVVPHFTIYLTQTNQTHVPNNIYTINKILSSIGLVITEQIFASELNPKTIKPVVQYPLRPQNLVEELQPYFNSNKKKANPKLFGLQELFRMLIYTPTTKEVKDQLKQQKTEEFQRHSIINKIEQEENIINLLERQCKDMKQFQAQRLLIEKHSVNTKPVYRQLQFEEPEPSPALPPNNICHFNGPSPSRNHSRTTTLERQGSNPHVVRKGETKICTFKSQESKWLKKTSSKKSRVKNDKKQKQNEFDYQQFSTIALSTVFKKSIIKPNITQKISSQANSFSNNLTTSLDFTSNPSKSINFQVEEEQNELSEQQFRKIMYNAFTRKNGVVKSDNYAVNTPSTPSTPQVGVNSSYLRSQAKKTVGYGSSFSHFIGKKQQQEELDCIEKQEKELYNKQLLNGEFIKNEIYQELENNSAEVFEDFFSIKNLNDTFRMEKRFRNETKKTQSTKKQTSSSRRDHSQKQSKKHLDIVQKNRNKYNEGGLIRNEKYSKSIKAELINNDASFLRMTQRQNANKNRLTDKYLRKSGKKEDNFMSNIRQQYAKQLKMTIQQRQEMYQWSKVINDYGSSSQQILL